jgi:hypothetical protein
MGLIVHSTLAVTINGLPLGLTSQQCWARPIREETIKGKARRRYITAIQEKESYKWLIALKETIKHLANTQIITIGDREADIFEFLWEMESLGTSFVVRNRQDRKFICPKVGKTKIQTSIKESLIKREITLQVPKKDSDRSERTANIEIKYSTGYIPIRSASIYGSSSKRQISDKIKVYIVSAKEKNPPDNVEAIDWTLLTNVPVNNLDDAIERITWYKIRWRIEEYFRILKSGCKIEDSRLTTKERLQRLIAIKTIIAFKILYLSKLALNNPTEPCTKVFSADEWKALYMREHQINKPPDEPPTIKEAMIWLGKLGGFMNRKCDKLPGAMSLWRGYENLKESIIMLSIIDMTTYG